MFKHWPSRGTAPSAWRGPAQCSERVTVCRVRSVGNSCRRGSALTSYVEILLGRCPTATAGLPKLIGFRDWLLAEAGEDTRRLQVLTNPTGRTRLGRRENAGRKT